MPTLIQRNFLRFDFKLKFLAKSCIEDEPFEYESESVNETELNQTQELSFEPLKFNSKQDIKDAIRVILTEKEVAHLTKGVRHNSDFVINLANFSMKNILSDDNGIFEHYATKNYFYEIVETDEKGFNFSNVKQSSNGDFVKYQKGLNQVVEKKIFFLQRSNFINIVRMNFSRDLFLFFDISQSTKFECTS